MSQSAEPTVGSPVADVAEAGSDVLENCLLELGSLGPHVAGGAAADAIRAALGALGSLARSKVADPAHLDLFSAAERAVGVAAAQASEVGGSRRGPSLRARIGSVATRLGAVRPRVIDAVVRAQDVPRSRVASPAGSEPLPFLASVGVPALHAVERSDVLYGVGRAVSHDLELGPDPADDLDRLRVRYQQAARSGREPEVDGEGGTPPAVRGGASHEPGREARPAVAAPGRERQRLEGAAGPVPSAEDAQDEELARLRSQLQAFAETIGMLGNLRRIEGEARWHERLPQFEQRLLDNLDALVALAGPEPHLPRFALIDELLGYAADGHGGDFVRAFARSLVLGCIDGTDTARAAVLALAAGGTGTIAAHREALALGSNPAIDATLRRLAGLPTPELQRMALELMVARGTVHLGVVLPLLEHPDDRLRAAALRCLGSVDERDVACEQLRIALEHEFDDEVLVEAIRSTLLCDPALGLAQLRARLTLEVEEPGVLAPRARVQMVVLLALGGAARDAELVRAAACDEPAELEALGWLGDSRCAYRLLQLLERDPGARDAAGAAGAAGDPPEARSDRASGEAVADALFAEPGARARTVAAALCRIFGLPGGAEAPHDPYQPPTDPVFWREWLARRDPPTAWPTRLRFGQPFQIHQSLDELERLDVPGAVRDTAAYELALVLGRRPVSVRDWVARQRSQLGALRATLNAATDSSGTVASAPPRRAALALGHWLGDSFRLT